MRTRVSHAASCMPHRSSARTVIRPAGRDERAADLGHGERHGRRKKEDAKETIHLLVRSAFEGACLKVSRVRAAGRKQRRRARTPQRRRANSSEGSRVRMRKTQALGRARFLGRRHAPPPPAHRKAYLQARRVVSAPGRAAKGRNPSQGHRNAAQRAGKAALLGASLSRAGHAPSWKTPAERSGCMQPSVVPTEPAASGTCGSFNAFECACAQAAGGPTAHPRRSCRALAPACTCGALTRATRGRIHVRASGAHTCGATAAVRSRQSGAPERLQVRSVFRIFVHIRHGAGARSDSTPREGGEVSPLRSSADETRKERRRSLRCFTAARVAEAQPRVACAPAAALATPACQRKSPAAAQEAAAPAPSRSSRPSSR